MGFRIVNIISKKGEIVMKVEFDSPPVGVKVKLSPEEAAEYDERKGKPGDVVYTNNIDAIKNDVLDRLEKIELRLDILEGRSVGK